MGNAGANAGANAGERPAYEFVDMNTRGADAVAIAFANQVAYCEHGGAPLTARVVAGIAAVLASDQQGELLARIRAWDGAPLADALPLRVAGGAARAAPVGRGACAGADLSRGRGG